MKKILLVAFMFCVIVGMLTFATVASAEVITGRNGDDITWTFDEETGILTISGTGPIEGDREGLSSVISYEWYPYKKDIKIIIIDEGVTEIGYRAFHVFDSLSKVVLPESLRKIGDGAFESCENLTEIDISNVEYLGSLAFWGTGLESVTIPDGITYLELSVFGYCKNLKEVIFSSELKDTGAGTFRNCVSLEKVVLPDNIEIIGSYAFEYCTSLNEIAYGPNIKQIGRGAFRGCTSLKKFVVPDQVEILEDELFFDCTSLEEVIVGDAVIVIDELVFSGCDNLKTIAISSQNKRFSEYNGALYDKDKIKLILIPQGYSGEHVVYSGTKILGDNCALNVKGLDYLILPEGIETIGKNAFSGSGLIRIEIPWTLKDLAYSAFVNCNELEEIWFNCDAPNVMNVGRRQTINAKLYYPEYGEGWQEFLNAYYTIPFSSTHFCSDNHDVMIIAGTPVSCEKTGISDGQKCKVCGFVLATQEEIPATGHKIEVYEEYSSTIHVGICITCGKAEYSYHKYDESSSTCNVCGFEVITTEDVTSNPVETPKSESGGNICTSERPSINNMVISLVASGAAIITGVVALIIQYKEK